MSRTADAGFQRNALAPGLIAGAALFVGIALLGTEWFTVILYITAILAAIIGWFTIQARQWWWTAVFAVIVILWNPIFPMPFTGVPWIIAQVVAAVTFLAAGALIKTRRS